MNVRAELSAAPAFLGTVHSVLLTPMNLEGNPVSTSRRTAPALHALVAEWLAEHPDFRIVDALPVDDVTAVTVANDRRTLHLVGGERALNAFIATPERTLSLALAQYGDRS